MPTDKDSESTPGSSPGDLRGYLIEMAVAFVLINLLVGFVGWLVGHYMGEPRLGVMLLGGGSLVVTSILGVIALINAGIVSLVRSIRRWTAPGIMDDDADGDEELAETRPQPPAAAPAPPPPPGRPHAADGDRGTDVDAGSPDDGAGVPEDVTEETETPEPAASVAVPVS